ncbi:MAG: ABC transporter permease [Gammaproteobacteria bacterium]|nr:ABC transporter permease [Gammaproteobacteria bacterium]
MNPHAPQPTSLRSLMMSLWSNRQLISHMTRREILGRYKGSILGLTWSFFNPIFMLAIYTFVFSVIFQSKWNSGTHQNKTEYAIIIFVGMIIINLFNEVANRAPGLILANTNYVKKVVFPIEILPIIAIGTTLFHALISFIVLLVAFMLFNGYLNWTLIFLPLILLPVLILTLGVAWILASIGVFVRDIGQTITILTSMLMFLSPVFYPVSAIPQEFRMWILANPLTFAIEQIREILIWGHLPDFIGLLEYTVCVSAFTWLGYIWFQKTRKGFADVL